MLPARSGWRPEWIHHGTDFSTDEQGRPFFINPQNGKRVYVSPVAMGTGPYEDRAPEFRPPEDTTGFFRSAPQWNQNTGEFETPIDWHNILNLAVGGMLTGGVANAALAGGAATAGGGAGAGVGIGETAATTGLASGAGLPGAAGIPGAVGAGSALSTGIPNLPSTPLAQFPNAGLAPGGTGAGAGGPIIPTFRSGVTAAMPSGPGSTLGTGAVLGGAAGLGAGLANGGGGNGNENADTNDKEGKSAKDRAIDAGIAAGLAGLGYATGPGNDSSGSGLSPELEAMLNSILNEQNRRYQRTGPLFDATTSGVYQMLPVFAREGGTAGTGLGAITLPGANDPLAPGPDDAVVNEPAIPGITPDPSRPRVPSPRTRS